MLGDNVIKVFIIFIFISCLRTEAQDNIVFTGDTTLVTIESIGHTDSSYSDRSFRIYNWQGESFIADHVFRVWFIPPYPQCIFMLGIGPEVNNGYRIYFYINEGVKTYVHFDTKLVQYRPYSFLRNKANNVEIQ